MRKACDSGRGQHPVVGIHEAAMVRGRGPGNRWRARTCTMTLLLWLGRPANSIKAGLDSPRIVCAQLNPRPRLHSRQNRDPLTCQTVDDCPLWHAAAQPAGVFYLICAAQSSGLGPRRGPEAGHQCRFGVLFQEKLIRCALPCSGPLSRSRSERLSSNGDGFILAEPVDNVEKTVDLTWFLKSLALRFPIFEDWHRSTEAPFRACPRRFPVEKGFGTVGSPGRHPTLRSCSGGSQADLVDPFRPPKSTR